MDSTRTRKPRLNERVIAGLEDLIAAVPEGFQDTPARILAVQYLSALVGYCNSPEYKKKHEDISAKTRDWHLRNSGRVITPSGQPRPKKNPSNHET